MKKARIYTFNNLIAIAFLLVAILCGQYFMLPAFSISSYAASATLYKPMPSEDDVERYGLTNLNYKYFGGYTQLGNTRYPDGSVADKDNNFSGTVLYDYVMGQINVLCGNSDSPEYYGTFDVAYRRYAKIYVDPVWLDVNYGILGPYTLKECLDNGWITEDEFYFVYQYETILDFGAIINDAFCHSDLTTLTFDDLSITSLTRESSATVIYENGYVYIRTLMDVNNGSVPNLFISFDNPGDKIDHSEHTHALNWVYNNIEWNYDGTYGKGPNLSDDDTDTGDDTGTGDNTDDGSGDNSDTGNTDDGSGDNSDTGNTDDDSGGDSNEDVPTINPDGELKPFNKEWCELAYSFYCTRCADINITPCSYEVWLERANDTVRYYAMEYLVYKFGSYEKYLSLKDLYTTCINDHSNGWSLVMFYMMYVTEYVSCYFTSESVRVFDGLSYIDWLSQYSNNDGITAYALYTASTEYPITYDIWLSNSKYTYLDLIDAIDGKDANAGNDNNTGSNENSSSNNSSIYGNGDVNGLKFGFDMKNLLNVFNPDFWKGLFSGNYDLSGLSDLFYFILFIVFIILLVVLLVLFMPLILPLVKIIFKAIFKFISWIVLAPVNFVKWIIRKVKSRKKINKE